MQARSGKKARITDSIDDDEKFIDEKEISDWKVSPDKVTENNDPLEVLKSYGMDLEGVDGFMRLQFKEIRELGGSVSFQIEFMVDQS